ncbi:hypothetical protein T310_5535, partial [Rasamsonia emersonii CBS 393.64]
VLRSFEALSNYYSTAHTSIYRPINKTNKKWHLLRRSSSPLLSPPLLLLPRIVSTSTPTWGRDRLFSRIGPSSAGTQVGFLLVLVCTHIYMYTFERPSDISYSRHPMHPARRHLLLGWNPLRDAAGHLP